MVDVDSVLYNMGNSTEQPWMVGTNECQGLIELNDLLKLLVYLSVNALAMGSLLDSTESILLKISSSLVILDR